MFGRSLVVALIASLLLAGELAAFQCSPEETEENLVANAKQILLVKITKVELVEVAEEGSEAVEVPRAEYQLVEALKGTANETGYVYDMPAGYGTGFVGLYPGIYYLLLLDEERFYQGTPFVDICVVPIATPNIDGTEPQATLARIRTYLAAEPETPASGFAEGHGTWVGVEHYCPNVCAMTNEEADTWLGKEARISATEVAFAGESCARASFSRTTRSVEEFYLAWRADPGALGLAGDAIAELEVLCGGEPWTAPGSVFIIEGEDRLLTTWDGVLFELARKVT